MSYESVLEFWVNGVKVSDPNPDPESSLILYLRNTLNLRGTKLGCAEGGCGACTVMLSHYDVALARVVHRNVNACLLPVCAVAGMAVTTIEGIGSTKTRLHPIQERLAKAHGSQCGFCTPGIVMSMYTLLRNNPEPTMEEIEDAFDGNLCRCTGYRPILSGFRTFAKDGGCCGGAAGAGGCCMQGGAAAVSEGCCKKDGTASGCGCDDTKDCAATGCICGCVEGSGDASAAGCCKTSAEGCCKKEKKKGALNEEGLFLLSETVSAFAPHDASQEIIFPPELLLKSTAAYRPVRFQGPRVTWYRPDSLAELLTLKATHPDARIVVGNTEVGIETKFKNSVYPVLVTSVAVPELTAITEDATGLHVGAAVTINSLRRALNTRVAEVARPAYEKEAFAALLENIRWFAGDQIRSVAALGGNIATASPISDLNPILMACGAVLAVESAARGKRNIPMTEFFLAYRKTALQPDEIIVSVFLPRLREFEFVQAYKQARRRDDDIAIVNACFRVHLTQSPEGIPTVAEASFAFGGLGPVTLAARQTDAVILGRAWNEDTLEAVVAALQLDFPLTADAPGGMPQYRQTLAASFFMKFFLTVKQQLGGAVPASQTSATEKRHRPASQSTQLFEAPLVGKGGDDPVGMPMMHVAAEKQVTGEAQYIDDIPQYHNELYGALVFSQKAHAKILSVDTTAALASTGVVGFFSAKDVRGTNAIGAIAIDEEVFATNTVTCCGAVIGIVVADTQAHAQDGAHKVKVEYEELPAIITIPQAIAAQAFYSQQTIRKGSPDAGFAASDHVVEGELHMGGQEHFYLETQATIAVPKEGGEMEIFASTQNPTKTQMTVAKVLGVPANRIVARTKRMGGGFGGKETRSVYLSCAVAVAASKLGRPVRVMLDRDEDMISSGGRHPFYAKYKLGFTKDGKIQALEIDMYSNAGNSLDLSASVMDRALFHMDNCYLIPNIRGTGFTCKTNLPTNTAFRGFGGPQGMFFAENWVSDIGRVLGMPQDRVRELNFYQEGSLTHYNQELIHNQLSPVWEETKARSHYAERCAAVAKFNAEHEFVKRGVAIIPTKFGIAFTASFLNQAGALVLVYTDGSVLLTHGGTEMGQGLNTKMIQVCAHALGVPADYIHMLETGTNTVPNASPTAASASSDLNGMAVLDACRQINERLAAYKAKDPAGGWKAWVNTAYFDQVSLAASGFYKTPDLGYSFETNSGRAFNYFNYGAACAEVEVDVLTGDAQVLHATVVMDVGASLNPAIDIGQVEGAFTQGFGLFCMEEMVYSPKGVTFTRGPGAYKIPGFRDIPLDFTVSLLRNAPNDRAVLSSKAVGEPPLFLGSSVYFAIKDALTAARVQGGAAPSELFRLDSPATVERVRMACLDRFARQFPALPADAKMWNVVA